MNQPIKNNINYQKFISNELNRIFDNMRTVFLNEYPVKEITPEYFLFVSLIDKDTLLYKTLSSFLTFDTISKIYEKLFHIINDNLVTILKPGREIPFSDDLKLLFTRSYDIMKEQNLELITTDTVLLAMIRYNDYISKLFEAEGMNYEVAENASNNLHNAINTVQNEDNLPTIGDNHQVEIKIISPSNMPQQNVTNLINNMLGNVNPKAKKNGYVATYCTNLNELAERGKIDDLIGRENEINTIVNILNRRRNNNVIIVGQSGVGKTQIVEGLAKKIVTRTAPMSLFGHTVLRLNVQELMAGTNLRGMFEERMIGVVKELSNKKNYILFIDDIQNYITDKKKEEYDFASMLNEIFSNGDVKVIATITINGYKQFIDNCNDVARKFQKLSLSSPTFEDNITIINGIKPIYENFHNISYTDDAITACVTMAERYMTERSLPSSAIDILDESGASKKLEIYDNPDIKKLLEHLTVLEQEKNDAIKNDNIDFVNQINDLINKDNTELSIFYDKLNNDKTIRYVNENDIYDTISKHTGIDVSKMTQNEIESLSHISDNIKKEIIGQDEAVDVVTKAIKRSKVGLFPKNRPILSCMCIGSTGVGKTLLAKKIAKEVFGNESNMLRFDMSEYSDKTSVNKLIGSSAGYVGYDKGGLLTEAVRNKKHTVLLIDEIEKADEGIYNLFLQILDEGFLTDNSGNKVDFKNTIIILTSNVGAKKAASEKGIGFNIDDNMNKKSIIEKELKKKFPPEFINRLDEIVYFNALNEDSLKKIIVLELEKLNKRLNDIKHSIEYDDNTVNYIYDIISKDKDNGARPILRAIQSEIENKITDLIIDGTAQDKINVTVIDDVLSVS